MRKLIKSYIRNTNPNLFNKLKIAKKKLLHINRLLVFSIIKVYFFFFKPRANFTCYSGSDGGGSQLLRILSVASLCNYFNTEYKHTPISTIDFYPKGIQRNEWIMKWNSLINFEGIYPMNSNLKLEKSGLILALLKSPWLKATIPLYDALDFANTFPDLYSDLIYQRKLTIQEPPNLDNNLIAIHLRKVIVPNDHGSYIKDKAREITNERFENTIEFLTNKYSLESKSFTTFVAYTDENIKEFQLKFPYISFDYQTNAVDAVKLMSAANVLVVAHSAMSYVAALFNSNAVYYYRSYFNSPKKGWKRLD